MSFGPSLGIPSKWQVQAGDAGVGRNGGCFGILKNLRFSHKARTNLDGICVPNGSLCGNFQKDKNTSSDLWLETLLVHHHAARTSKHFRGEKPGTNSNTYFPMNLLRCPSVGFLFFRESSAGAARLGHLPNGRESSGCLGGCSSRSGHRGAGSWWLRWLENALWSGVVQKVWWTRSGESLKEEIICKNHWKEKRRITVDGIAL